MIAFMEIYKKISLEIFCSQILSVLNESLGNTILGGPDVKAKTVAAIYKLKKKCLPIENSAMAGFSALPK